MERQGTRKFGTGPLSNESILRSEMPWASFQTAGIITKDQLELIYTLDKQEKTLQATLFHNKGPEMVTLFVDILAGINKDEVITYALAMLSEITDADASCALLFTSLLAETQGAIDPMAPVLKLLGRSSVFIVEKAAIVLARVLAWPPPAGATANVEAKLALHLSTFAEWTVAQLKQVSPVDAAESPRVGAAMGGLQTLVSSARGRIAALEADALVQLSTLVTASTLSHSASTVQLLYQTLFAIWSLSYSPEATAEMASSKWGLVAKLVDIVKKCSKEKVVRVALATLRNLLGTGTASNDMVVFGLMPVLEVLMQRKFADEDIPEDIEILHNTLQINLLTLSSWDVYKNELDSGCLEWSPCHKSEIFWKDNHKLLEANNCTAVKQLVHLLESEDPQVLAIACNDISEFIKHSPDGRRIMTQYGAKPLAMQVLKHPDAEVQKHALTCVQRLMVINWEYLNKA